LRQIKHQPINTYERMVLAESDLSVSRPDWFTAEVTAAGTQEKRLSMPQIWFELYVYKPDSSVFLTVA